MFTVTNIQKYSIHDGPGIRTTAFFKGCPLRCIWCHNPETQKAQPELLYDRGKCTSCGRCILVCPGRAAVSVSTRSADGETAAGSGGSAPGSDGPETVTGTGGPEAVAGAGGLEPDTAAVRISLDRSRCTACGVCVDSCPAGARSIAGKEMSARQIVKAVLRDQLFYDQSGGGVTLSGGEVLAQDPAELEQLLRTLKREGLSIAVDTCGAVPWERVEMAAKYADIFLYDVKVMDPEVHRAYTGSDNVRILENLKSLRHAAPGARIFIRIPTVDGISGTAENMEKTAAWLLENGIRPEEIDLLPYHDTGSGKYGRLDRTYEGTGLRAPDGEKMDRLRQVFLDAGFANVNLRG